MEIEKYNKIVKGILNGFKENEKIIIEAFKTELQDYGHKIDFKDLKEILNSAKDIPNKSEVRDLEFALYYSGNSNITLSFLLFALKNDVTITLYNERYDVFNTSILAVFENVLEELKIENKYIKYDEKYDEQYLINHEKDYNKIIFIGDYFEYKNLKHHIKREIVFDNFGFIKGYIDKEKCVEEYQKIMKFCYINNIDMDFYTNKQEFLEEVSENDKIILLSENKEELDNLKEVLKSDDIICNEFPYENYKFDIKNVIRKI